VTDGGVGLSFEQQAWITVSHEIETQLLQGFTGEIVLHCLHGVVTTYDTTKKNQKPGEERRTAGPRDGEERRTK